MVIQASVRILALLCPTQAASLRRGTAYAEAESPPDVQRIFLLETDEPLLHPYLSEIVRQFGLAIALWSAHTGLIDSIALTMAPAIFGSSQAAPPGNRPNADSVSVINSYGRQQRPVQALAFKLLALCWQIPIGDGPLDEFPQCASRLVRGWIPAFDPVDLVGAREFGSRTFEHEPQVRSRAKEDAVC